MRGEPVLPSPTGPKGERGVNNVIAAPLVRKVIRVLKEIKVIREMD